MPGWPASDARARRGLWSTSTPGRIAVHASTASDPLRAGAPSPGLRFSCVAGWGWVAEMGGRLLGTHTPAKNPLPVSGVQAYMACSVDMNFEGSVLHRPRNDRRNGCRNALETVLL